MGGASDQEKTGGPRKLNPRNFPAVKRFGSSPMQASPTGRTSSDEKF